MLSAGVDFSFGEESSGVCTFCEVSSRRLRLCGLGGISGSASSGGCSFLLHVFIQVVVESLRSCIQNRVRLSDCRGLTQVGVATLDPVVLQVFVETFSSLLGVFGLATLVAFAATLHFFVALLLALGNLLASLLRWLGGSLFTLFPEAGERNLLGLFVSPFLNGFGDVSLLDLEGLLL